MGYSKPHDKHLIAQNKQMNVLQNTNMANIQEKIPNQNVAFPLSEKTSSSSSSSTSSSSSSSSSRSRIQVSLLYSKKYTNILHETMNHIHADRDLLLSSLLYYCGFIKQTPSFFTVVKPKIASRKHLESFHDCDYLDLIECCGDSINFDDNNNMNSISFQKDDSKDKRTLHKILDEYGLTDDCPIPTDILSRMNLWHYCLSISGASIHGAHLLLNSMTDVAINFGGGRHHAQKNKAGGFCYINDVVLAIQKLLHDTPLIQKSDTKSLNFKNRRVLYLDLDIHHCDGVQSAFYDTDQVLTISLHRYTPGFFPTTGSLNEKGKHKTNGVGYNLNVPMPRACNDADFVKMCKEILIHLLPEYDPEYVVVCVGADGLRGDNLVKETGEGWNLTPEGLAECVRLIALECAGGNERIDTTNGKRCRSYQKRRRRKLFILGGGGYNPSNTARTFLLCTAAACEGARPGMLNELPNDVPQHEYFSRYGPSFELFSKSNFDYISSDGRNIQNEMDNEYTTSLKEGIRAINLTAMFLKNKNNKERGRQMFANVDNFEEWDTIEKAVKNIRGSRKRRQK